ncbi:hypothetical protein CHS0354_018337 [Potamilus streckersoni]|uniref:Tetratricopeptide repeat protein n=1 Tax=Potamilus streckersoni TaxID=2493646 RepID=A0AAE0RME8_9BIVA|nr:hypothetical protein CHS0354_018337 [Potamilus streckersoni]
MASELDEVGLTNMETFPSFFYLTVPQRENKQYLMSLRDKITREMKKSGFETDAEWEAAYNFISFVHWLIGEEKEAMKFTEKVLIRNSENLIAHGNRIWMNQAKGHTQPAGVMDKLKVLVCKRKLLNRAKFEQALAYSRFGPKFYKCSIDLFQEIIDDEGTDLENMYLSKFGLALLLKRQFNVYNIFCFEHLSDFENSVKRAVAVVYDVAKNAISDRYRARGWVMLGEIVDMLQFQQNPHLNLLHILPTNIKEIQGRELFERGYNICNDDVYVLERFGKQARSWKDFRKSEMLLRRSLEIRKTALAHHQLAITLRSVLNKSIISSSRKAPKSITTENSSKCVIPEEYKTFKFMNTPKKVLSYPHDSRTDEILNHLDMSLECSPLNSHAMYDKGLLFRSLGWYDQAIEIFEHSAKEDCAPLHEVKCFEQHALCLIELASAKAGEPYDIEEIRSLYHDAKRIMFLALQKSAYIATSLPLPLKTELPTIKKMLLNETDKGRSHDRMTLEALCNMYQLVGEYGQVLPFYKEISEMSDEDANDQKIILRTAENYVKQGDFSNSLILLDLIEASCTRLESDHRKLYFEAYLHGALNTLEMNEADEETVKMRFKRIAQFCSKRNTANYQGGNEFGYDIHIQSSEALKEDCQIIQQVFTDMCGLNVSRASKEHMSDRFEMNTTSSVMEQSCLIVFILNDDVISEDIIKMALNFNLQEGFGPGIVSIRIGQVIVPTRLQQFPVLLQPKELDIAEMSKDEKLQWIRLFFLKSAEQTFPFENTTA